MEVRQVTMVRLFDPVDYKVPYSISIHNIGLGGVMASPAFRRRQEDLGRMATELAGTGREDQTNHCGTNYLHWKQFRRHWNDWPGGHVRGKIVARVQS
jgi:hypothetical protein